MDEKDRSQDTSPNLVDEYRSRAAQLARRYAVVEGVVGVALVGGVTLGHADRYSDIDLIVYLRHRTLLTWYLGKAPLPEGQSWYHGLRLDVSYRDFESEQERDWSSSERWQAVTAELLYDPEGLLRELFSYQIQVDREVRDDSLLEEVTHLSYLINSVVPAWLYRGDLMSAHQALSGTSSGLLRLLFLANAQPVPSHKWLLALSRSLEWRPTDWDTRLADVLTVREITADEASRRRYLCQQLLRECWEHAFEPDADVMDQDDMLQFRMLSTLAERQQLSLEQYREHYDVRLLSRSPAIDLVSVHRHDNGITIRFDRERLHQLVEHDLGKFLDHQQRLLRQLASHHP